MFFGASPKPRRAKLTWIQWIGQSFAEDPDDPDEEEYYGDRHEESDDYDLGCLILASVFAACLGGAVALLVMVMLG